MKPTVIYISSDNRSGSTLLDQLLGSNPDIVSLGEIVHLGAYVAENRATYNPRHPLVCSCGARISACPFWTDVEKSAGRPLSSFRIGSLAKPSRVPYMRKVHKRLRRELMGRLAPLNRWSSVRNWTGGTASARESYELFDAIGNATGKQFIVDSSKDPLRFIHLYHEQPSRIRVLLLARDYRGVVHSKMKRDVPIERAVRHWAKRMRQMDRAAKLLPEDQVLRVTYEDLCLRTALSIRTICEFIGVPFSQQMLARNSELTHHVGGSPSKFDASRGAVALDRTHRDAFSPEQLALMRTIAGPMAARWGYDLE